MPKLNFVFAPHHNSGAHFVLWSMYYLSGQLCHWNGQELCQVVSPTDLIQEKNAHHHRALRASGLNECIDLIKKSQDIDIPFANVYVTPLTSTRAMQDLYKNTSSSNFEEQLRVCNDTIIADTQKMIDFLQNNYRFSVVKYAEYDRLNVIYNDRCPCDLDDQELQSIDAKLDLWQKQFYKDTDKQFESEIWDRREMLSLIVKIDPLPSFDHMIDYQLPNLIYTTDDIWNNLPDVMSELLEYYQMPLEHARWPSWKQAYYVWREKHDNHFSRCFDQIINAIVNNHYMSLTRFNLNFYKEMLIQQALITRYNLNLKTWQLAKFPSNTQQLHQLLEPNTHIL
jgi:hypothetical protein